MEKTHSIEKEIRKSLRKYQLLLHFVTAFVCLSRASSYFTLWKKQLFPHLYLPLLKMFCLIWQTGHDQVCLAKAHVLHPPFNSNKPQSWAFSVTTPLTRCCCWIYVIKHPKPLIAQMIGEKRGWITVPDSVSVQRDTQLLWRVYKHQYMPLASALTDHQEQVNHEFSHCQI